MTTLRTFATEFFRMVGAQITSTSEGLQVTGVPPAFQKFYGKHEPYTIVFEEHHTNETNEFMGKGSYLLKAMSAYLESSGETTLFKIALEDDPHATVARMFTFDGVLVRHITSAREYAQFVRFTFQTFFKYMNEKEIIITEVYRDDKSSFSFNPEEYTLGEGKKREVITDGIKPLYTSAKEDVRKALKEKTSQISETLSATLHAEITRVRAHYDTQIKEIDEGLGKNLASLRELETTNKDVKNKEQKIERLKEQIRAYQTDNKREQLVKEADFFEQSEIKKHGLSIDTKLLNTTVFYFPVFTYGMFLKKGTIERLVTVRYDPLKKAMSPVVCDSCGKAITTITLDFGGHVICPTCQVACGECNQPSCNACLKHTCAASGKKLCGACTVRCQKCGKIKAKKYMHEHKTTGIRRCITCWKRCPTCDSLVDESEMRGSSCQACARKAVGVKVRKNVLNRDDW